MWMESAWSFQRIRAAVARRTIWRVLGTITRVNTPLPVAALTFDDGPEARYTLPLLELLEAHGARGTFFMVGKAAQQQPKVVQRVLTGGHVIGNHSWDHPSFPMISGAERRRQLRAAQAVLGPQASYLFRPPFGHLTLASRFDAGWLGYTVVTWDVVANDWQDQRAADIASRVLHSLAPGSIVLFHDSLFYAMNPIYRDRSEVLGAVEEVLKQCAGRLRFVTVPELLALGRPQREYWRREGQLEWLSRLTDADGRPWSSPKSTRSRAGVER